MRNVSDNTCRENQNTFYVPKVMLLYEIRGKIRRSLTGHRHYNTAHALTSRIPKATNTLTEYVILTAFLLQQFLHKRASALRYTYITSLNSTL